MARRTNQAELGRRRAGRLLGTLGQELRDARTAAGLSLKMVANVAGCSSTELWRIEHARAPWLTVERATVIAAVEGLELTARVYPAGVPLRDAAHLRLIERFRQRLSTAWTCRTEVPLPIPGDLRAIDVLLTRDQWRVGVEAETILTDRQALTREIALKKRDGKVDAMVLLVLDSKRSRDALALEAAAWREAFPAPARTTLRALAEGSLPDTDGIVLL